MEEMKSKIRIRNLNLFYGGFQALHDINLNIPENEITAFIGPSGCGKSTLLKSINRMNDMVEGCKITGEIDIGGKNILDRKIDVNLAEKRGNGLPEAESVSDEHLRQHRLRASHPRNHEES